MSAPFAERVPGDLAKLLGAVTSIYLPYLDANAAAYVDGRKRVRYDVQGVTFDEPTKPYRVWCRDRLQRRLVALDPAARSEVARALGAPDLVARLSTPSPKPAPDSVGVLPLAGDGLRSKPVDSWWR